MGAGLAVGPCALAFAGNNKLGLATERVSGSAPWASTARAAFCAAHGALSQGEAGTVAVEDGVSVIGSPRRPERAGAANWW